MPGNSTPPHPGRFLVPSIIMVYTYQRRKGGKTSVKEINLMLVNR